MAAVGMAYVSPEGKFQKVNDRFCELTGYTRSELIGMSVIDLTHPEDRDWDRLKLGEYLGGRLAKYSCEKRYLRKDGSVRWVSVTARAVNESYSRLKYSIGIVEDITERRRAEEALRESEERLRLLGDNLPRQRGLSIHL
jgi:PAS domain S-box-containing protein